MGHPRPLFRLFSVFTNKQTEYFLQKINKTVYPVSAAGIRTHELLNRVSGSNH